MKYTAKQYGLSLYEITEGLPKNKIDRVIGNFLKILIKNNHLSLIDKIIFEFKKIEKEKKGIIDLIIESPYPLNKKIKKDLVYSVKKMNKAGYINLEEKVNLKLIGGLIVQMNDILIDGSLSNKLYLLKDHLKK